MTSLDLALIGNSTIGALVNRQAEIVWLCMPGFDGDPVFCSLLMDSSGPEKSGMFAVELIGGVTSEQHYIADTPILVTRLLDASGSGVQVTDFCPRFQESVDVVAPMMLVRRIERIRGNPVIRIRLRPRQQYGAHRLASQRDADGNRLLFGGEQISLRLTTDAPLDSIVEETPFSIDHSVTLLLGPDESVDGDPTKVGQDLLKRTESWWRQWTGSLTAPAEWREAVVRAAITLKLNVSQESGATIAAITTSIPEARDSSRNWDYRYCWLRDSYFVVDALYRLGDSATTARYVEFVMRIVAGAPDARLAPMYSLRGGPIPDEREAPHLAGYRGMGPVRIGNQAYLQTQHDAYGESVLAALPLFFDSMLADRGDVDLFNRLESLGAHAANLFDKPDAGLWELRGSERVHTFSSVMCWAACDA